ncbi:unnamed protein product [Orchesella dallaii]|uniref:Uncharacterized protein n=1 Tax=Orchesella dallaii TaxID=48710 RepID=A0ABP1PRB3_9HEXA
MLGEIQIVQSSEFLEFFKLFREANINNWDNANCILALVHWITLKKDYLLFIPGRKSASTEYLDYFSKRIRTNRDGSRVGFFTYIHKHTGLKKILEFHEANTTRNKLISFVWQDNMREQDRGIFYDRNIPIHLFIRDLNGETPKEVYDIHRIWMLTTMINVGLVSERHLKKAYIMTAKDAAQCENQKTYLSQLLQSDCSDYSDPTDREYLDTWWALDGNSSLAFIAFHIHKVVINFDSMFNLSLHEEGSKKPRCYVESNGKRILEAFYLNASSLKLTKLTILEVGNHGTEGAVTIDFGGQTMKLYEREYVRNGELDCENLWKLTTKISVNLLTKLTMDKLKELLK